MIKLFSLKQQKKDEESAGGNRTGAGGKKASAAQLRIQKGRQGNRTAPASWSHAPASTTRNDRVNNKRLTRKTGLLE